MNGTIELQDRTDEAERVLATLRGLVDEAAMPAAARTLVAAAALVFERTADPEQQQTPLRRLGYVLMADGLLAVPEALQQALRALRDDLVRLDPGLAQRGCTD